MRNFIIESIKPLINFRQNKRRQKWSGLLELINSMSRRDLDMVKSYVESSLKMDFQPLRKRIDNRCHRLLYHS